jgi:hypothetical protein
MIIVCLIGESTQNRFLYFDDFMFRNEPSNYTKSEYTEKYF